MLSVARPVSAPCFRLLGVCPHPVDHAEAGSKLAHEQQRFALHIISRKSGKPAVAELATALARSRPESPNGRTTVSIADVKSTLEGEQEAQFLLVLTLISLSTCRRTWISSTRLDDRAPRDRTPISQAGVGAVRIPAVADQLDRVLVSRGRPVNLHV